MEQVHRACLVYGVYDILAEVETDSMDELEDVIARKIKMISGIRSTLTVIGSKRYK